MEISRALFPPLEALVPFQRRFRQQIVSMADCIVVFARLPVVGQVKTRLAASVGHHAACAFYSSCAEHVLHEVAR